MHSPAPHPQRNPAAHLRPHLVTVRLLEVLLVDFAVLHPGEVALVVDGEEVQRTTHTFLVHRIRDRDHRHLDVEGEDDHTLIRDRLQGHRQGGEAEDHHQEVRQGGDGGAQAIARIVAIVAAGPVAEVDL